MRGIAMKTFFKRLFGRLFGRKKKKAAAEDGAWFNNAHTKKRGLWSMPTDPGAPWSDNSVDNAETMKWAKD